eukprot:521228_1
MSTWASLQPCPSTCFTRPLSLNKSEFVIALSDTTSASRGIYIYNINHDKWEKIIDYPSREILAHASAYLQQTKILYVYNVWSSLLAFDLETKSMICVQKNDSIGWGIYPQIFFLQNELNVIGFSKHNAVNTTHSIYKINENNLQLMHTFPMTFVGYKIIKIKSKEIILFGGCHSTANTCLNDVYRYSFSGTWHKLSVKMPKTLAYFGIVCTRNDEYIIILGGQCNGLSSQYKESDDIFIYDVKRNQFYQSKVKCPIRSTCKAVITGDELYDTLLTFAYVNDCYKLNMFSDLEAMPHYLIKFMSKYLCNEKINLLSGRKGLHWRINVDDILKF